MPPATSNRLLLTVTEAVDRLAIGRSLVYQLVLSGELPSVKIGRARRVPVAAVEGFVARLAEEQRRSAQ
jgi:excisionase family DNA binding protein